MAKKNTEIAVQPAESTANLAVEFGPKDYEIASAVIAKCYGALRYHGTALMLARCMIAVPLAQIRAHDLTHKTKGLQAFYKLAERGGVNLPKMSKRTLERCLQVFDAYCKEKGISKKDVPALPGIDQVKDEQLELWNEGTPENASPLLLDLMEWSRKKGLTLLDNEVETAITPPPHVEPEEKEPVDETAAAVAAAEESFTTMKQFLETDLYWQQDDKSFLEPTGPEAEQHTCTWSLLGTPGKQQLLDMGKRLVASAERALRLDAGRVSTKKQK